MTTTLGVILRATAFVPGSFLLVAIPEAPTAQIDEAGVAFDAVVRIDPLNHEESTAILAQRIVGMPSSFVALCNCLGNATPRGLIRAARSVFDSIYAAGIVELGEATSALVTQRLQEAVTSALAELQVSARAPGALMPWCVALEAAAPSAQQLLEHCRRMDAAVPLGEGEADPISIRVAGRLAAEEYFCATLLEVFHADASPNFANAGDQAPLDMLAAAGGQGRVSPAIMWQEVSRVRELCGLPISNAPRALLAS